MIQASSKSELARFLPDICESPQSPRRKGTKICERHAAAHLLGALAEVDDLKYPLRLEHRDRPDFLLAMNDVTIGVEHTTAISQGEAYREAIREEDGGRGPNLYWHGHIKPGEPVKKRPEFIAEIEANVPGNGFGVYESEREWADCIRHFAEEKIKTLQKPGFDRFDEDWLLIHDRLLGLWPSDLSRAVSQLRLLLQENGVFESFVRLFVLRNRRVCEVSSSGSRVLDINDRWLHAPRGAGRFFSGSRKRGASSWEP